MGNNKQRNYKELDQDWTPHPGQKRFARVKRIMATTDTRHINKMRNMDSIPEVLPPNNMSKIFGLDDNNKFKLIGYQCRDCGKSMSNQTVAIEHPLICNEVIKINKLEEKHNMPIHKTEKGYQWGTKGPYTTKEKAEQVQRAAYATGYKEKQTETKKKD